MEHTDELASKEVKSPRAKTKRRKSAKKSKRPKKAIKLVAQADATNGSAIGDASPPVDSSITSHGPSDMDVTDVPPTVHRSLATRVGEDHPDVCLFHQIYIEERMCSFCRITTNCIHNRRPGSCNHTICFECSRGFIDRLAREGLRWDNFDLQLWRQQYRDACYGCRFYFWSDRLVELHNNYPSGPQMTRGQNSSQ